MSTLFYRLAWTFLALYFRVYHRLSVTGREHLPRTRPLILAANHGSYLDPPVVGASFPGVVRGLAWDGLFRVPLLGGLITLLGAVPVSHEDRRSAAGVLRLLLHLLERGESVMIFPEGQRSADGTLQPLEGGAALLALKAGVPVVPVRVDGAFEALPPSGRFPAPRKIRVTFREALLPEDFAGLPDREARRAFLERLRQALLPDPPQGS